MGMTSAALRTATETLRTAADGNKCFMRPKLSVNHPLLRIGDWDHAARYRRKTPDGFPSIESFAALLARPVSMATAYAGAELTFDCARRVCSLRGARR